MEKYHIGNVVEDEVPIPFPEEIIGKDYAIIDVRTGSRIFNLVKFAQTSLAANTNLVISACGPAITKAVTIAEIIKRKQEKVYQWNKIGFREIKEFWDPNEAGMTRLRVTRELPTMHIYLTKTPLDESLPGVQVPRSKDRKTKPTKSKMHRPAEPASKGNRGEKRSRRKSATLAVDSNKADGAEGNKEQ
ncbi:ribonuclease P protein subunit p25 [Galendromus occidentalis]|uniref:Ribonuclease P protein subunit p25 n=1 Tax=Galendromus occidentalis TaxID=34638 RepID=A0AAJ6VUC4_9ACAR|nr:ribonuclease P protein subunit p25 [Galendromus occidentalis]